MCQKGNPDLQPQIQGTCLNPSCSHGLYKYFCGGCRDKYQTPSCTIDLTVAGAFKKVRLMATTQETAKKRKREVCEQEQDSEEESDPKARVSADKATQNQIKLAPRPP